MSHLTAPWGWGVQKPPKTPNWEKNPQPTTFLRKPTQKKPRKKPREKRGSSPLTPSAVCHDRSAPDRAQQVTVAGRRRIIRRAPVHVLSRRISVTVFVGTPSGPSAWVAAHTSAADVTRGPEHPPGHRTTHRRWGSVGGWPEPIGRDIRGTMPLEWAGGPGWCKPRQKGTQLLVVLRQPLHQQPTPHRWPSPPHVIPLSALPDLHKDFGRGAVQWKCSEGLCPRRRRCLPAVCTGAPQAPGQQDARVGRGAPFLQQRLAMVSDEKKKCYAGGQR